MRNFNASTLAMRFESGRGFRGVTETVEEEDSSAVRVLGALLICNEIIEASLLFNEPKISIWQHEHFGHKFVL